MWVFNVAYKGAALQPRCSRWSSWFHTCAHVMFQNMKAGGWLLGGRARSIGVSSGACHLSSENLSWERWPSGIAIPFRCYPSPSQPCAVTPQGSGGVARTLQTPESHCSPRCTCQSEEDYMISSHILPFKDIEVPSKDELFDRVLLCTVVKNTWDSRFPELEKKTQYDELDAPHVIANF